MSDSPEPTSQSAEESERAAINWLLSRLLRNQLLVGLLCVIVAIAVARAMTHGDIQELKRLLAQNRCQCDMMELRATATSGNVTIIPDYNTPGQLAREMLIEQGKLHDVRGVRATAGSDQRTD